MKDKTMHPEKDKDAILEDLYASNRARKEVYSLKEDPQTIEKKNDGIRDSSDYNHQYPKQRRNVQTTELVRMSLLVALVCVMAQLSIPSPMGVGMISLITIALCLIGLLLPPKQAFLTVLVYVLLGAVGLPVFTGFTGGMGKILGPTGGFILIWPIAYTAVSCLKGTEKSFLRYAVVATVVSIVITYVAAVPYFMFMSVDKEIPFTTDGLQIALGIIFYPYVVGDIVKAILSAWIATKIKL